MPLSFTDGDGKRGKGTGKGANLFVWFVRWSEIKSVQFFRGVNVSYLAQRKLVRVGVFKKAGTDHIYRGAG